MSGSQPDRYGESSLLDSAIVFATGKHDGQTRKNAAKDPYIVHPIEVMTILKNCGVADVHVLCGAVLHDTVEDTETTAEELRQLFGEEICQIVLDCSDDKSLSKVDRKRLQISHAEHISDKPKLVKLADKLSNISNLKSDPPAKWSPEVIFGYVQWGFAVCQHLYGVNEQLDNEMKSVFDSFGITSVTNDDLEEYYRLL